MTNSVEKTAAEIKFDSGPKWLTGHLKTCQCRKCADFVECCSDKTRWGLEPVFGYVVEGVGGNLATGRYLTRPEAEAAMEDWIDLLTATEESPQYLSGKLVALDSNNEFTTCGVNLRAFSRLGL